jgi:Hint domain/RTX calcium-binding nonapeptide repeat (4 copies)
MSGVCSRFFAVRVLELGAAMGSLAIIDANGFFQFIAGAGADTLNGAGTTGASEIFGGSTSAVFIGGSGADTLVAGAGADTMTGGAGADTFVIGAGAANAGVHYVITDFTSNDILLLGGDVASTQAAIASAAGNTITLGNGATVTFANVTVSSIASGIKVTGSTGVSTSTTTAALTASGDTLLGSAGQVALVTAAADSIVGGASSADTVSGNSISGLSITGVGNFVLFTAAGDSLAGATGAETITSSAGSVSLVGTASGEVLYGGPNTHTITGGAGIETLTSGAGNDALTGGGGNDYLDGGIGTDVAVYTGPRADYLATTLAGGGIQIADERAGSPDGADTVVNVENFQFSDGTFTAAELFCFYRGTLIGTADGEVPVETLKRGDLVSTSDGRQLPVRWLGRQTVSTKFADPLRVLPIRIKAGALGAGVPSCDLLLSPDHAILVEDILVQASALVNGTSIIREADVPETFTYYHIELDDHSLVLAQNTAAETFIDNVERLAFDNWTEHEALYPEGKPIVEMPYPRAKSRRQVPRAILERLAGPRAGLSSATVHTAA